MIHNDPITCARYYDHKTSYLCTLFNKDRSIFKQVCDFFFVIKFQNRGNEHENGLLWIKNAPIYGINTNIKIEFLLVNRFHVMYNYYRLHYKMHNNINTLKTCKKKIMLFVDSIIHHPP